MGEDGATISLENGPARRNGSARSRVTAPNYFLSFSLSLSFSPCSILMFGSMSLRHFSRAASSFFSSTPTLFQRMTPLASITYAVGHPWMFQSLEIGPFVLPPFQRDRHVIY